MLVRAIYGGLGMYSIRKLSNVISLPASKQFLCVESTNGALGAGRLWGKACEELLITTWFLGETAFLAVRCASFSNIGGGDLPDERILRGNKVAEAGVEPARGLPPTGF